MSFLYLFMVLCVCLFFGLSLQLCCLFVVILHLLVVFLHVFVVVFCFLLVRYAFLCSGQFVYHFLVALHLIVVILHLFVVILSLFVVVLLTFLWQLPLHTKRLVQGPLVQYLTLVGKAFGGLCHPKLPLWSCRCKPVGSEISFDRQILQSVLTRRLY